MALSLTLRGTKGSPLTATEHDQNLTNIKNLLDSIASGSGVLAATSLTLSGSAIAAQGVTVSSGYGLKFPATNTYSSDANTLDDYEENTWTPAAVGCTITVVSAKYTKIGNKVFISAEVSWPVTADTSQARLTGLPFVIGCGSGVAIGYNSSNTNATGDLQAGGSTLWFYVNPSNGGTSVTNANFSGAILRFSGSYCL